jgi:hypothetical protein
MATSRGTVQRSRSAVALLLAGSLAGCAEERSGTVGIGAALELETPAPERSAEPNLAATSDGRLLLSWIEPREGGGSRLRFAALGGAGWGEPSTIAEGDGWFTNWADFPMMVELPGGRLAAHYLVRSEAAEAGYHYDVRIVQSQDGGVTWSAPVTPHRDGVPAEHGFVSLFPVSGGELGAIWLDGRGYHPRFGATGEMALRFTTLTPSGSPGPEVVLDERICDCCQTSVALTGRGPVAVYRDRSVEEVRDISIVRLVDGEWTGPRPVHEDGWRINACPVNGPAVSADGDRVAVAWFTAAQDDPRVLLALAGDAGESFRPPIRVDDGEPIGRVDVLLVPGGGALVSWMERPTAEGDGLIRYRLVGVDGRLTESRTAGVTTPARQSGFPRMARSGDRVAIAWTRGGPETRVQAAILELEVEEL